MDITQEFLLPDINKPVRYLYEHYFEDAAHITYMLKYCLYRFGA